VPLAGETPLRGTPVATHNLRPAGNASVRGIPAGTQTLKAVAQALKQEMRDCGLTPKSNGNVIHKEPMPAKSQFHKST
jgi:hypothetical protein